MKKRLLIMMALLVAIATGASAATLTGRFIAVVYCEAFGNDDASRNREFEFNTDGTLTVDFPSDSFVFVRNYDTGVQYCTDGWSNFANPVTLVNENKLSSPGNFEKFYVPSGEHTLYLVDNGDDTFTIAYDINILKKAIYVYPKAWDMTGNKIALYSWNPEMFDDLQLDMTYPQCYMIKVDNNLTSGVLVLLPETATNSFDNKLAQTSDVNFEQPDGTNGDILIVIKDETNWLNQYQWDITTIDHLDDYLTVTPTIHDPEIESACDYYNWHGITYTTSGEYQYEEKDADGNVTDIYTLNLTIYKSTSEERYDYATVGSRYTKEPFDFIVEEGKNTYYYTITNAEGCDHVITLHLTLMNDEVMDAVWNEYAYDDEVGTIYSPESTTFKVWNPLSTIVKLNLYATGSDIEEGAAKIGTYTMDKLMDGDSWTGIWTTTIDGDYKNKYYTYTIDGTEVCDPWALTAGKDNLRSMVCDEPATNPSGWNSDYHRFYEPGNAVEYVNVPEFSADPMCGVSEANRGKYLALTESGTTEGNAGEVLTCMSKLKEDGVKAIVIDIAAPLMMPDQYVSNPYDGNSLVSEFKQMVQAVHDTFGMSVFVRLDFSTIPPYDLPYQPQPDRYLLETCLHWVNEYHVDGIVLATDLSTETKTTVRAALDAIDTQVILTTDDELEVMTGINAVTTEKKPTSKAIYNLQGQRVSDNYRGIVIVNGRKIVK